LSGAPATTSALYEAVRRAGDRAGFTNPLFDIAGATAGVLRMPVGIFLFWTWIGKTLKMLVIAYAGSASLDWLERYLEVPAAS
jgi:hypothetical protein